MSVATIREAIAATIETVPAVGQVQRFQRNIRNTAELIATYGIPGNRILGWSISRLSARETMATSTYNTIVHRWEIRGYMGLRDEDETEIAFDILIEAVRSAFRDNDDLGGAVDTTTVGDSAGAQLIESGPGSFMKTLVHAARLILETEGDHEPTALVLDPFITADMRWDLGPLPDGEIDANDQITLEQ